MDPSRPDVFTYTDHRSFLRDMVEFHRFGDRKYSLIYFSKQIGFSGSYLKLVVNGKRSLNADAAMLLAKNLRCDSAERGYFLTLALKDEAEAPALKDYYEDILLERRKQSFTYRAEPDLNSIFTNSLIWEIFSLIGIKDFSDDVKWIANKLSRKKTSPLYIEESLRQLKKLGAIVRKEGKWTATNVVVKHTVNLKNVYLVALRRAIEHLAGPDDEKSYFDSFCLILSNSEYDEIREILEKTKRKIAGVALRKGPKDRIAFFNSSLFFASK